MIYLKDIQILLLFNNSISYQAIQNIQMSKGVQYLRDRYQQLYNYAYNNEMKKVVYKDIVKYKQEAIRQMGRMDKSGVFNNYDQVDFYKDKFTQLDAAMVTASKNQTSMKDFTVQAKAILKDKGYINRNSYLSQPPADPKVTSQPPAQSKVLQSFFDEKRSKIVPDVGFRSLLQNPPISQKSFKKRIGVNNEEISRLRSQNQQLKRRLENGNFPVGGGNLEVQIRRQQQRIRFLQNQNQRLSKDNTKLKSQKSVTVYTSPQPTYQDYLYSPYIINPRENDLLKISMRTSQGDSNSYYNQNFNNPNNQVHYDQNQVLMGSPSFSHKYASNFGNNKDRNIQTFSQMNDYQRNKDRYSVFDMSKSHYSDMGMGQGNFLNSGSSGVEDNRTAGRNKVAFFKSSGMLVRDQDIQIAYKRTQTSNLNSNRVILYFNNKLNQIRKVNVSYEFQQNYYNLNVTEKIQQVAPLKQARQVVEVILRNNQDLNSVIQANVQIDGKRYKLWLPAIFIKFEKPREGMMQSIDKTTKIVYPSKIFSNQIQTQKIIQNIEIYGRGQAWAWGISPAHEGPIKFAWKQANKLEVTTSNKWIDFITFIMFDYR